MVRLNLVKDILPKVNVEIDHLWFEDILQNLGGVPAVGLHGVNESRDGLLSLMFNILKIDGKRRDARGWTSKIWLR